MVRPGPGDPGRGTDFTGMLAGPPCSRPCGKGVLLGYPRASDRFTNRGATAPPGRTGAAEVSGRGARPSAPAAGGLFEESDRRASREQRGVLADEDVLAP